MDKKATLMSVRFSCIPNIYGYGFNADPNRGNIGIGFAASFMLNFVPSSADFDQSIRQVNKGGSGIAGGRGSSKYPSSKVYRHHVMMVTGVINAEFNAAMLSGGYFGSASQATLGGDTYNVSRSVLNTMHYPFSLGFDTTSYGYHGIPNGSTDVRWGKLHQVKFMLKHSSKIYTSLSSPGMSNLQGFYNIIGQMLKPKFDLLLAKHNVLATPYMGSLIAIKYLTLSDIEDNISALQATSMLQIPSETIIVRVT
jgi:hypothetical protein